MASAALGAGLYRGWPTVLPLAEKLHVFALDELGHGFTDPPRDIADLGHVRLRAEHVIRFIEEQGPGPINLCGQSQGGWIVTYITITYPDLVKKLVLVDSGNIAGSGFKTGGEKDVADIQEIDGGKIQTAYAAASTSYAAVIQIDTEAEIGDVDAAEINPVVKLQPPFARGGAGDEENARKRLHGRPPQHGLHLPPYSGFPQAHEWSEPSRPPFGQKVLR